MYCTLHAEDGMVDPRGLLFYPHLGRRQRAFDAENREKAKYCKQHAGDGVLDVVNKRCPSDSCTAQRIFNAGLYARVLQ